jgi:hypothetical protein
MSSCGSKATRHHSTENRVLTQHGLSKHIIAEGLPLEPDGPTF